MAEVTLSMPSGVLTLAEDGSAQALLRVSIRNRQAVIGAVEAMAQLRGEWFWLCDHFTEDAEGLHLHWPKPGSSAISLAHLVLDWRKEPGAFLPSAIGLACQVLRASSELEYLRPLRFLLSPVQVFSVKDEARQERWMVLPLPLEGMGCADFVRADGDTWAWLPADELLHAAPVDRGYLVGAAIYYCLISDLTLVGIGRNERMRRLLLYRAGNSTLAHTALASAVPKPLAPTARRLANFVMGLLSPSLGRAMTARQAASELDRYSEELSAHHLAAQWEHEGNYLYALRILNTLAATVPDDEVPWEAIERLRTWAGDVAGAAQAAARRRKSPAEQVPSFIVYVRELANSGEQGRHELERLMTVLRGGTDADRLTTQESYHFTDEEYLHLAYANGRWLTHTDEALQWLRRDFSISWYKVVQTILTSRLCAEQAKWIEVIQNCREGRRLVAKMPNAGGNAGSYAETYLNLLDGIAHICAVYQQKGDLQVYLNDAFTRFENAWLHLHQSGSEDLASAIISWLLWLGELAGRNPRLAVLSLGVEAFCQSLSVDSTQRKHEGSPPIPWFDEARLFTA